MKRFVRLFEELDATTKSGERIELLKSYLNESDERDRIWCIALLIGKRPKRPVKTTLMKQWAAEIAAIPEWLFDEAYNITGDLGETLALLVPQTTAVVDKPLNVWMSELSALASLDESAKKNYVTQAWLSMNQREKYVFNKLIGGSFRIGISGQNVIRAIAAHKNLELSVVSHALTGNWSPFEVTLEKLLESHTVHISKPYPFFLAHPLEQEVSSLGDISRWQIEHKWDGIRGQLIVRSNELFLWSRGEELITEKFPEFTSLKATLDFDIVLDGEILCHDGNSPLPFGMLQTRLGRKKVSAQLLRDAPVKFMVYDLLEFKGQDFRNFPLFHRRQVLEHLFSDIELSHLMLSGTHTFSDWPQVIEFRSRSREYRSEGLMLKHLDSVYGTGRKRGGWWKWKLDAMTIDAVLIYAMQGHGRRANLFTDYTFAVWHEGQLIPFTKAYSGLTDEEMIEVDRYVRKNTIDKFGPVRSVVPELVFEIAFEGIQRSTRHKSGIALRFPRIHRWRKDKKAADANTRDDLMNLLSALERT